MALQKNRGDREYLRFFQDNVAYVDADGTAIPTGVFVGGQYNLSAPTYSDGDPGVLQLTADGRLKVDADITVTNLDVEIGAVEIKNATDDTRAKVKSDGVDNALVVTMNSLPAQTPIIATGNNVIGKVKIVDNDGTNIAGVSGGRLQVGLTLHEGTSYVGKVRKTDGTTDETFPTTAASVSGASTDNLLAASTGTKKHKIFYMILNVDTAGTVTVSDGIGVFYMGASTSVVLDFRPLGLSQSTADTAITVTNGGGGNWNASLTYSTVA